MRGSPRFAIQRLRHPSVALGPQSSPRLAMIISASPRTVFARSCRLEDNSTFYIGYEPTTPSCPTQGQPLRDHHLRSADAGSSCSQAPTSEESPAVSNGPSHRALPPWNSMPSVCLATTSTSSWARPRLIGSLDSLATSRANMASEANRIVDWSEKYWGLSIPRDRTSRTKRLYGSLRLPVRPEPRSE